MSKDIGSKRVLDVTNKEIANSELDEIFSSISSGVVEYVFISRTVISNSVCFNWCDSNPIESLTIEEVVELGNHHVLIIDDRFVELVTKGDRISLDVISLEIKKLFEALSYSTDKFLILERSL